MSARDVGIVATGVANLEAVAAAFRRLDHRPWLLESAGEIGDAPYIVLPGVGSFASGMAELARRGWVDAIRQRVEAGRPTLAICLGLQLLCEASDEAPGVAGLGCVPGRVGRFGNDVRVPQLGWNQVKAPRGTSVLRSGIMYFANSYRLARAPRGWRAATCRYGARFVAGLERGGVVACQFHPELSGRAGQGLLARWLEAAPEAGLAAGEARLRARRPGARAAVS